MTQTDFKRVLIFLRKTEAELTQEDLIILFGQKGSIYWNEFINFDHSLNLLFTCLPPSDQDKLSMFLSKRF